MNRPAITGQFPLFLSHRRCVLAAISRESPNGELRCGSTPGSAGWAKPDAPARVLFYLAAAIDADGLFTGGVEAGPPSNRSASHSNTGLAMKIVL